MVNQSLHSKQIKSSSFGVIPSRAKEPRLFCPHNYSYSEFFFFCLTKGAPLCSGSQRKWQCTVFNQQYYLWTQGHDPFVVKTVVSITEHKIPSSHPLLPGDSTRHLCQAVMLLSWFNQVETWYIIQPLLYPFKGTVIAVITLRDCKGERQPSQPPEHYMRKGFVT